MKLSKLIDLLKKELEKHGDTVVLCDCEPSDIGLYPCDYIDTGPAYHYISEIQINKFNLKKDDLVTFIGVDLWKSNAMIANASAAISTWTLSVAVID